MSVEHRSERRLVTCLFIDVVGSTEMTVARGPERMKRELDRAFAELRTILVGHGGTIEKYVGDAIFVLFGAPMAHANDPERALRAATACCEWATAHRREGGQLHVRAGIETGEALVDLDAIDDRQQMVVGTVVNLASRLQAYADPDEVLVGPTCRDVTADVAEFAAEREAPLKGIGQIAVAALASVGPHGPQRPLPFVGRGTELATLRRAFDRARGGRATFALVSGPPGQGKSRLAEEALAAVPEDVRVLAARCRPGSETGASTPLRQLVAADVGPAALDALAGRIAALLPADGQRTQIAEAVAHSAGIITSERLLGLGAAPRREAVHDAWRRYLGAIARERPVVLWVEDLHWAEPHLVGILDRLASRSETRVLVLGTARPEFLGSAALRPSDDLVHVELGPLSPDDALRLARSASTVVERTVERAEGNPLFIIELARARRVGSALPMTVQAAIAARIDELAAEDRRLIQHAAVVGETFGIRDAAMLSDRDAAQAAGALARLAHGRYLSPIDGDYRFHHALVRDVAYGRVPVAERMRLHARYAREGVDPEDAEALAHHWWEALRPPDADWVWEGAAELPAMRREALDAHLAAGRRRAERLSHERATELYDRARIFAAGPLDVAAIEEGLGWADALAAKGDGSWDHWAKAMAAYRQAGRDPPARLYADMLAVPLLNNGYFRTSPAEDRTAALLDEGERIARATGDESSLLRIMALHAVFVGDPERAREARRLADAATDQRDLGETLRAIAIVQYFAGRLTEGEATFRRIDEVAREGGFVNVGEVLLWRSLLRWVAGDLEGATALARELDAFAARSTAHTKGHALGVWAMIALAKGDWSGVRAVAQDVERLLTDNPELPFCSIPAAATAAHAAAEILAGRAYPERTAALVERMIPSLPSSRASSLVVPLAMSGRPAFGPELDYAYLARLWYHRSTCDPLGFNPPIALTIARRHEDLPAHVDRLEAFAATGSAVAGALAAALREELAPAEGGSAAEHAALRELGYTGLSDLLRFRPD